MRRPFASLHHHARRQHAGFEIATYERPHARVRDPRRDLPHEDVVIHPVEELRQVHVHHPVAVFLHVPLRLTHGVVRTPARPKAIAERSEGRIDLGLQDLKHGLLDEPIEHGRDA